LDKNSITPQELEILLSQGENKTVEFKTSFNKDALITIIAFANAKG